MKDSIWRWLRTSLYFLVIISTQNTIGQSCAYSSSLDESGKLCVALGKKEFISNSDADKALNMILSTIGASKRFILRECSSVDNACATTYKGVRYIFYNDEFMDAIVNRSDNWSNLSILAHEIGHHINGHTLEMILYTTDVIQDVSLIESRKQELEADEFSGFVMARLGATKEQALTVMKMIASDDDDSNSTHPTRSKRLSAITKGYENGKSKSQIVYKDKIVYKTKTDTIYVTPQKTYEDFFYEGIEHYYNNQTDKSLTSFLKSVNENPKFTPALNNLGLVYNDLKLYQTAIGYFDKALDIDSRRIDVIKNRAIAHYNNENYENAIKDLSIAIDSGKEDSELIEIRGNSYFNIGDYKSALLDFKKLSLIDPTNDTTLYKLGLCFGLLKDYQNSLYFIERAVDISRNIDYLKDLTIALLNSDNSEGAISILKELSDEHPQDPELLLLLADAYFVNDNDKSACDCLLKAKALGKEDASEKLKINCTFYSKMENKRKRFSN